jgi:hypothetical protein
MSEVKTGISKTMFVIGLIVAIVVSSLIASVVSMQYAKGSKGDKGDTGATGPQGPPGFGTPDYDSGWRDIATGQTLTLAHVLKTTNVYVYVVGKNAAGEIHQSDYGWLTTGLGTSKYGLNWISMDADLIKVTRGDIDGNWGQVRVMIWIIS